MTDRARRRRLERQARRQARDGEHVHDICPCCDGWAILPPPGAGRIRIEHDDYCPVLAGDDAARLACDLRTRQRLVDVDYDQRITVVTDLTESMLMIGGGTDD